MKNKLIAKVIVVLIMIFNLVFYATTYAANTTNTIDATIGNENVTLAGKENIETAMKSKQIDQNMYLIILVVVFAMVIIAIFAVIKKQKKQQKYNNKYKYEEESGILCEKLGKFNKIDKRKFDKNIDGKNN